MPIRAILSGLVAEHAPAVRAVVFCDEEGERVVAVTREPNQDPYELDLMGASYCAITRAVAEDQAKLRVVHHDMVVHVRLLVRGYYVLAVSEKTCLQLRIQESLDRVGDALLEQM